MSDIKNDEYIEISIKDILCKLWRNKLVFIVALMIALIVGGIALAKKNYNGYTYFANVSLPIYNDGRLILFSRDIINIYNSDQYNVTDKDLNVDTKTGDYYSINLTYVSNKPIQRDLLDKRVENFVNFFNSSDSLNRATTKYVNSLNEANQHIKLLDSKIKQYKSKHSSEVVDLAMTMLKDNLITYESMRLQAELDIKNAKFVVNQTSVDYAKISKKKYILVVLVLSFLFSVFAALGVDYLREKFLNRKS
ncbi:GumC domain-containing protein [Francisella frigiditurris]|uniref:Chain length determinant family protein n=1 Tax=Francisella frigiditurris TaxID=1542390 RepID=A0A1J0KTI4_9GAMM|nr:hypothetical protein [Francisella frigiditurris]APC96948.1 hypothetical protein KX01_1767 [Francisella frigiditurris]